MFSPARRPIDRHATSTKDIKGCPYEYAVWACTTLKNKIPNFMPSVLLWVFAFAGVSASSCVVAAGSLSPEVEAKLGGTNNLRLAGEAEDAAQFAEVSAALQWLHRTRQSENQVNLGGRYTLLNNSRSDNYDGAFLRWVGNLQTRRIDSSIDVRLDRSSLLATTRFDTSDPVDTDIGIFEVQANRDLISVQPSLTWTSSRRVQVGAGAVFLSHRYDSSAEELGLLGFDQSGVFVQGGYLLGPDEFLGVRISGWSFDPQQGETSDFTRLGLVWLKEVRERYKFELEVGWREADLANGGTDDGFQLKGLATTKFKFGELLLILERSDSPSGEGESFESSRFQAILRSPLSRKLRSQFTIGHTDMDTTGSSVLFAREYSEIEQAFTYSLSRRMTVGFSLQYRRSKRDGGRIGDSASAYAAWFSISYSGAR